MIHRPRGTGRKGVNVDDRSGRRSDRRRASDQLILLAVALGTALVIALVLYLAGAFTRSTG